MKTLYEAHTAAPPESLDVYRHKINQIALISDKTSTFLDGVRSAR